MQVHSAPMLINACISTGQAQSAQANFQTHAAPTALSHQQPLVAPVISNNYIRDDEGHVWFVYIIQARGRCPSVDASTYWGLIIHGDSEPCRFFKPSYVESTGRYTWEGARFREYVTYDVYQAGDKARMMSVPQQHPLPPIYSNAPIMPGSMQAHAMMAGHAQFQQIMPAQPAQIQHPCQVSATPAMAASAHAQMPHPGVAQMPHPGVAQMSPAPAPKARRHSMTSIVSGDSSGSYGQLESGGSDADDELQSYTSSAPSDQEEMVHLYAAKEDFSSPASWSPQHSASSGWSEADTRSMRSEASTSSLGSSQQGRGAPMMPRVVPPTFNYLPSGDVEITDAKIRGFYNEFRQLHGVSGFQLGMHPVGSAGEIEAFDNTVFSVEAMEARKQSLRPLDIIDREWLRLRLFEYMHERMGGVPVWYLCHPVDTTCPIAKLIGRTYQMHNCGLMKCKTWQDNDGRVCWKCGTKAEPSYTHVEAIEHALYDFNHNMVRSYDTWFTILGLELEETPNGRVVLKQVLEDCSITTLNGTTLKRKTAAYGLPQLSGNASLYTGLEVRGFNGKPVRNMAEVHAVLREIHRKGFKVYENILNKKRELTYPVVAIQFGPVPGPEKGQGHRALRTAPAFLYDHRVGRYEDSQRGIIEQTTRHLDQYGNVVYTEIYRNLRFTKQPKDKAKLKGTARETTVAVFGIPSLKKNGKRDGYMDYVSLVNASGMHLDLKNTHRQGQAEKLKGEHSNMGKAYQMEKKLEAIAPMSRRGNVRQGATSKKHQSSAAPQMAHDWQKVVGEIGQNPESALNVELIDNQMVAIRQGDREVAKIVTFHRPSDAVIHIFDHSRSLGMTFNNNGTIVNSVIPNGQAALFGIVKGCTVQRVNGMSVYTAQQIISEFKKSPGKQVEFKIAYKRSDVAVHSFGYLKISVKDPRNRKKNESPKRHHERRMEAWRHNLEQAVYAVKHHEATPKSGARLVRDSEDVYKVADFASFTCCLAMLREAPKPEDLARGRRNNRS